MPRLGTPRQRVPSGSVAIAGRQTAVYPQATPGGWQLIGRTEAELWNPSREQPALIRAGDTVRFVAHARGVVEPGTLTTIQDGGRPRTVHLGVPVAGACDPDSLAIANALLGNEPTAAAIEMTVLGATLRVLQDTWVGVAGAAMYSAGRRLGAAT